MSSVTSSGCKKCHIWMKFLHILSFESCACFAGLVWSRWLFIVMYSVVYWNGLRICVGFSWVLLCGEWTWIIDSVMVMSVPCYGLYLIGNINNRAGQGSDCGVDTQQGFRACKTTMNGFTVEWQGPLLQWVFSNRIAQAEVVCQQSESEYIL